MAHEAWDFMEERSPLTDAPKHGNRTNVFRYDYLLRTLRWFNRYLAPGDHRMDPPPPVGVDYRAWMPTP